MSRVIEKPPPNCRPGVSDGIKENISAVESVLAMRCRRRSLCNAIAPMRCAAAGVRKMLRLIKRRWPLAAIALIVGGLLAAAHSGGASPQASSIAWVVLVLVSRLGYEQRE